MKNGRKSYLEAIFEWQLKAAGIPYRREFRWHPKRKWRSDFYLPMFGRGGVLVEIEGGIFRKGRHTTGIGFTADCEKYNEAVLAGYRLIRGTAKHVKTGQLFAWVERALA